jgi:hypothetical protein
MCHSWIRTDPNPKAVTTIGAITKARSEVLLIVLSCHPQAETEADVRAEVSNPRNTVSQARSKPKWTLQLINA